MPRSRPTTTPLVPLNSNQSSQRSTTVVGEYSNSSTADNSPTDHAPSNNPLPTPQTSPSDGRASDPQSRQTPTPTTARARLAVAVTGKKSRKRKRGKEAAGEEAENAEDTGVKQRVLDRLIRWNTFLYFTNDLWKDIIEQAYGEGVDIDSIKGQAARSKIFNCVKGFKNRVIKNMEVCHSP